VLRTQSDDRLIALAREGREAAFEEIVRRYRPGLVAFAAAYAPRERAEDVVQESLVNSWKALAESEREINLKPWLYTIVRNRALNARRDAKAHEPLSENIDGVPQPPELVLGKEELAAVVTAVGMLPEPQREALVRSALDGHTHDQIAAALGSSPGAVRQLIYRARINLRTGVGLMIPLPLVRLLTEQASGEVAVTGLAAGGAAAGAAGGGSVVTKLATVAAVGALATGSGVAIQNARDNGDREGGIGAAQQRSEGGDGPRGGVAEAAVIAPGAGGSGDTGEQGRSDSPGSSGEDRSGGDGGSAGPGGSGPGGGSSGPGGGGSSGSDDREDELEDEREAEDKEDDKEEPDDDSSDSGHGSDDDDDAPEVDEDRSGSGSGSGSGSSGSGSGAPEPDDDPPDDDDDDPSDSSGSGSGSLPDPDDLPELDDD
jgi:RNA polymerase sigma factor (sigma-70 family)